MAMNFPSKSSAQCGLVASEILVNISSDNGLLPGGTKPLPEPVLSYHQNYFVAFPLEVVMNRIYKMCSEMTLLKITTTFPRGQWIKQQSPQLSTYICLKIMGYAV